MELIKALRKKGFLIYIYTTSYRSRAKIRMTFFSYGLKIDGMINQQVHIKTLKQHHSLYSKYPPAFGIDVHINDFSGVEQEGERYQLIL